MKTTKGPEGPSDDLTTKRTEDSLVLLAELATASNHYRILSADTRRARVERDRPLAAIELDQARGSR